MLFGFYMYSFLINVTLSSYKHAHIKDWVNNMYSRGSWSSVWSLTRQDAHIQSNTFRAFNCRQLVKLCVRKSTLFNGNPDDFLYTISKEKGVIFNTAWKIWYFVYSRLQNYELCFKSIITPDTKGCRFVELWWSRANDSVEHRTHRSQQGNGLRPPHVNNTVKSLI